MNEIIKNIEAAQLKETVPSFNVGDTVRVSAKIKEGNRERIQVFEGTIIAKKHGGIEESITVRRISYGVGCEKVFPVHAPNVVDVETVRHGKVRRAKLYYLRDRLGKGLIAIEKRRARVSPSFFVWRKAGLSTKKIAPRLRARQSKLHILHSAASGRVHTFRCFSSPSQNHRF